MWDSFYWSAIFSHPEKADNIPGLVTHEMDEKAKGTVLLKWPEPPQASGLILMYELKFRLGSEVSNSIKHPNTTQNKSID